VAAALELCLLELCFFDLLEHESGFQNSSVVVIVLITFEQFLVAQINLEKLIAFPFQFLLVLNEVQVLKSFFRIPGVDCVDMLFFLLHGLPGRAPARAIQILHALGGELRLERVASLKVLLWSLLLRLGRLLGLRTVGTCQGHGLDTARHLPRLDFFTSFPLHDSVIVCS